MQSLVVNLCMILVQIYSFLTGDKHMAKQNRHKGIEERIGSDGQVSYRAKVRVKGFPAQSATFVRLTDAVAGVNKLKRISDEENIFKLLKLVSIPSES